MHDKQARLEAIENQILNDNIAPQLASSATQLVYGSGSAEAEVLFIGEAPGKKEDETGKPFVGAAGKLLDELLEKIKLHRQDVYITNIVKYRPLKNRDPSEAEKKAFWPYLESQIEVIQPKLIVTLGRHSLNCFLPDLIISKAHGQLQKMGKWNILPIYHPAAALYNGSLKSTLTKDFQQIPKILKNIK